MGGGMIEKRRDLRVEPKAVSVRGKLYNVINFRIRDISEGGICLLSNFMATVGSTYSIFLFEGGHHQEFDIRVVRAEVDRVNADEDEVFSPGLILAISACFVQLTDERSEFLKELLSRNRTENEVGFFPAPPLPTPGKEEPGMEKTKKGKAAQWKKAASR